MAVTRIKNNQITDSTIVANAKVQNYSVTSTLLANNLTYGSDLTITGNLTVNGQTTTIDTNVTTIEDPVIVLASNQTGSPTVDIGFIGERGTSDNIAMVWDESADEFITAFTSTTETNTTITISSYANFHTNDANIGGNIVINGTTSLVGNLVGPINSTGNITGGNLLTPGLISATGNITGGNVNTAGAVNSATASASGNVTGGNLITAGAVNSATASASGNVTGGNVNTAGQVVATGNVSGGNVNTAGQVVATGNITGGNLTTSGITSTGSLTASTTVSATGNITGGNVNTAGQVVATGNVSGGNVISSALVQGVTVSASGNVIGGNVTTTGLISATGNINGGNLNSAALISGTTVSATGNVIGGNVTTAGLISATGNINGGNLVSAALVSGTTVSATGNVIGGNLTTSGITSTGSLTASTTVSAAGNITGGNVNTAGQVVATGNITGGNVTTAGITSTGSLTASTTVSATGNITGGNVLTGGLISATGNITGGNVTTSGITSTGSLTASTTVSAAGNITGGNIITTGVTQTGTLTTTGNAVVGGNLFVLGNITYNNVDDLRIQDPVIIMGTGPNGAPLTGPDSFDRGIYMEWYKTGLGNSWIGWQNSSGNLVAAADVIFSGNDVIQVNSYGTFQAGNLYIQSAVSTGNVTGGNLLTSGLVSATGNITGGNLNTSGSMSVTGNLNAGNLNAVNRVSATTGYFTGNVDVLGNLNATIGVVYANSGIFYGNAVTGNNAAFAGIPGFTQLGSNVVMQFAGNVNSYSQINFQNINNGTSASTDYIATADNGTDTSYYLDVGINSSTFNDPTNYPGFGPNDSYVHNHGGNLILNPETAGKAINFMVGGTANANVIGYVNASGLSVTGIVSASGNVTGGNVLTGGLVSATGNVNGGNLISAALVQGVTLSASGNVIGGNVTTAGQVVATGNITGGNLTTSGITSTGSLTASTTVSATGNVTGGNLITAGQLVATGNVNGGNVLSSALVQGVTVSASGNVIGGNVTTAGLISATGNINGGNLIGAALVQGVTVSASGNVIGGNVTTAGLISATGNLTSGNVNTAGLISATGNIYGGNLILAGAALDTTAGRLTVNSTSADADFAVNGDTTANVFYVDAGTGTASFGSSSQTTEALVAFNTPLSILFPVGNVGQRPSSGVTGMVRFNTTSNALEVYDNSQWTTVGVPSFTVIADDQFNGDGVTVAFTLSSSQTTNSCIVSINGVVQIPTVAYSVSGTTLTFTEAPQSGDVIDVREITTTTSVTSISNGSGNAEVATSDTSATVNITGDLVPTGNLTGNLGSATNYWKSLFVGGSTIYLGNIQLKAVNGQMAFYAADGTTPATIASSSVDTTTIASGTSSVAVIASGGNVRTNIAGATVQTISSTGVAITGDLSVTGNATLSGNILGDRIQNGTTQIDIQTQNGNANITVAGTSNVAVFASTGAYVTGVVSASGNITGGNISATNHTGTTVSVSGNVTGGNLTTAGQLVSSVATGTAPLVIASTTKVTNLNVEQVDGYHAAEAGTVSTIVVRDSSGYANVAGLINSGANGVGNIGSSTTYFNTVFAKATSAQYADLAEKYVADAEYPAGTVVVFGGDKEVTVTSVDADRAVAGVVSTNPSYIMNGALEAEFVSTVALTGRVPCRVTGTVRKGDLMVSAGYGLARAEQDPRVGTVIGKALENFEGNEGVIEVVVGRF